MEPAVITFGGDLDVSRYPEVHTVLEAAKVSKGRPMVLDLSGAGAIDPMIAGEIVLFVRRSLRYGATVAIVPPPQANEWLTHAGSIRDAHFRETREDALALVGSGGPG
ncbi:MAG TPA: STAS domain-containing protein [Candidatus Elarobacter sp.]|jgi:anti-anti-sigma regulatory factor